MSAGSATSTPQQFESIGRILFHLISANGQCINLLLVLVDRGTVTANFDLLEIFP